jgi:hypothetical protein
MPSVDQIQARLRVELSRADEIEAQLMQPASPAEEDETPATWTGLLQDGESMPTLTDEIKTFIVKGLACYDTPSQVAEAVKVHFDVEITRQHVYAYDPNASQNMAPRWRELHAATRQAMLRETAEIGIAHRAVRLRRLDRLASRCERNSVALALKCLEIAAKDTGGLYENRKPVVLQPTMPQPAIPEPPTPHPAAVQTATPQAASLQPAPLPAAPQVAIPQPSAPPPVMKQPSMPERAAPQPVMPQPVMPALAAPQPLAVLAQAPQPPALSQGRPLSREERYRAYVRDRHARDRAIAAEALLNGGQTSAAISSAPPE